MKVTAEVFTGRLFYVEVGEDITVGDLKNVIGNQEDLPTDRLILMLDSDGQQLLTIDENPVSHYGVQDGSHVYIFFRPIDDGYSASPSTPKESTSIGKKPENKAYGYGNGNNNGPSSSVDSNSTQ